MNAIIDWLTSLHGIDFHGWELIIFIFLTILLLALVKTFLDIFFGGGN